MDIDACPSLDVSVDITRESVDDHGYSWIYIDVHGAAGTAAGLAPAPMAGASATDAAAKGARPP
jgi:hypothetical protein